jgi:transcriptional regulator with XRE-family HTH domain
MDIPEITRTIAIRVKELRTRQGVTSEQLADKLREHGVLWDRVRVTKLEKGHRQHLTVVEMLALSRVLNVAPVHLLVPPTNEGAFQVTPGEACTATEARDWIRGDEPLPGTDLRVFRTEVPLSELGRS